MTLCFLELFPFRPFVFFLQRSYLRRCFRRKGVAWILLRYFPHRQSRLLDVHLVSYFLPAPTQPHTAPPMVGSFSNLVIRHGRKFVGPPFSGTMRVGSLSVPLSFVLNSSFSSPSLCLFDPPFMVLNNLTPRFRSRIPLFLFCPLIDDMCATAGCLFTCPRFGLAYGSFPFHAVGEYRTFRCLSPLSDRRKVKMFPFSLCFDLSRSLLSFSSTIVHIFPTLPFFHSVCQSLFFFVGVTRALSFFF